MEKEKQRLVTECIKEAEAIFDKGCVMQLGTGRVRDTDVISTGSLSVDFLLGCGGFPRAYMTEVYGPEGGGKSTLCLQAVAEAQKIGEAALYLDTENKLSLRYAEALGVNIKDLLVCQPDYGEAGLQIVEIFIKNKAIGLVVVDSVAMLIPKAEFEGEIGDAGVGMQSRMLTQAMRKLKDVIRKSNVAVVFINQIRDKIGVSYGSPETTPGGHAIRHQCSVRMDIRRIASLKDKDLVVGARTKTKVVKSTFASPFQETEYDLIYGEGISKEYEVLDLGVKFTVVEKDGNKYLYKGQRLGVGREASRKSLKENPDLFKDIYGVLRKTMFPGVK